jgi:hypothetical protein
VVEDVGRVLETARAAHDGNPLPDASGSLARRGRKGEVEVHVVGDGEVELAVAVVVDEGTAGAPLFSCSGDSGLLGYLFEGAIALVVEEAVFAVAGDVEIVESVVVIVSDAGALAPACGDETCLRGDIGEGAVVIVVEEVVGGFGGIVLGLCVREIGAVDEEDVGPAVAVVVENGHAGAGGDIDEPGGRRVFGRWRVGPLGEGDRRKEDERTCEAG